jgi:hypothetical protein
VTQQVGSVSWGAGVTEAGHSRLHAGPHSARSAALANLAQVPMQDSLVGLLQACRHTPSSSAWLMKLLLQRSLQARVICSGGFCTPFTYIRTIKFKPVWTTICKKNNSSCNQCCKKRGVETNLCHSFLCSHKFHKIKNYFSFKMLKKKIVTKLSNIWEKTYSGSRI